MEIPETKRFIPKGFELGTTLSNEDMILALAGQFKQLSHEPEKYDMDHQQL